MYRATPIRELEFEPRPNSFGMHTCEESRRNLFRMHTYKTHVFKSFRLHTYNKTPGGYPQPHKSVSKVGTFA